MCSFGVLCYRQCSKCKGRLSNSDQSLPLVNWSMHVAPRDESSDPPSGLEDESDPPSLQPPCRAPRARRSPRASRGQHRSRATWACGGSTADGSVVQFVVGEDGLDPTRISFLQQPEFFARNARVLQRKWEPPKRAPKSMSAVVAISARNARIIAERDALAQGKELAPLLSQTAPGAALGVVRGQFTER